MPRVIKAVLRQVAIAMATLLILSVVVFLAVNAGRSPNDLATQALGPHSSAAERAAFIHTYGLDQPIAERYTRWLGDFAHGDWGVSYITQRPVEADVVVRLERTLILAAASLAIALPLSLVLGLFMARWWGSVREEIIGLVVILLNALPEFVIGTALIIVFAAQLNWLPPNSSVLAFGGVGSSPTPYVLPVITLVIATTPYLARVARAATREALAAPYARAAVLRGLGRQRILWDHVMRNAAVSIVNAVAISIVYLIGGVIVVENVFAFPGVGQALIQAIGNNDAITVEAVSLAMGAIFIATSLIADVLVIYFNPRLRRAAA
jgi:peptide/nickel transport system permease protein